MNLYLCASEKSCCQQWITAELMLGEKNISMALVYSCWLPEGVTAPCTLSDFQGEWSTLQYVSFQLGLAIHPFLFNEELYPTTPQKLQILTWRTVLCAVAVLSNELNVSMFGISLTIISPVGTRGCIHIFGIFRVVWVSLDLQVRAVVAAVQAMCFNRLQSLVLQRPGCGMN